MLLYHERKLMNISSVYLDCLIASTLNKDKYSSEFVKSRMLYSTDLSFTIKLLSSRL